MSKEEQIAQLEANLQLYDETLMKERKIKEQLLDKLEYIKELVNTPTKKKQVKSARTDFLAGNGSLLSRGGNKSSAEIVQIIRDILK
jgi:hypothetical protein